MAKEKRMNNNQIPDYFYHLTQGLSNQSKTVIRYWIILSLISLLTIMTINGENNKPKSEQHNVKGNVKIENATTNNNKENSQNSEKQNKIKIPIIGVKIPRNIFYPFALGLISVIMIAYGSANCQWNRTRILIQKIIKFKKERKESYIIPEVLHIHDYFDSMLLPIINRVAPVAQILRGKYQFYPKSKECPCCLICLSLLVYFILKLITFCIVYIFPFIALVYSWININPAILPNDLWRYLTIFFKIISIVAISVLILVIYLDLKYTKRALKVISKPTTD